MKKFTLIVSSLSLMMLACTAAFAYDATSEIPEISVQEQGFKHIPDVAQYGCGDWSQVVGIARRISLTEAFKIASDNPKITYFFYTKGGQMVLVNDNDGAYRVFRHGDTVFFSGEPWWGSAPGLADGYVKE